MDNKLIDLTGLEVFKEELDTVLSTKANEAYVTQRLDTQDAEISLLNGNEVIVVANHAAVSSPNSQKIYREQGATSYTDYMYQNNAWKTIATYNFPGTDNKPTVNSDNLVKSGGVFEDAIYHQDIPYTVWVSGYVKYDNGTYQTSSDSTIITDVDVSAFAGKTLFYSRMHINSSMGYEGMAFYDNQQHYISGVQGVLNANELSISTDSVLIPSNAKYASFTCPTSLTSDFKLFVTENTTDAINGRLPLVGIDEQPTENSSNLVRSGGVVEYIQDELNPPYVENTPLNPIFKELYINGYKEGYHFSYCTWNGSKTTIVVRDAENNVIIFINNASATAGEVFCESQNGATLYAVFTTQTYSVSPQDTNFGEAALNIKYNPQIFDYIAGTKSDMEYPLNISRFNQGGMLPAGYYASWITISRRMDNEYDSVLSFANKTYPNLTNKWFDFYAVGKHTRGIGKVSKCDTYIDWSTINELSTSDALMMPVIVGAVNNIDGDNPTMAKWHTGGAHGYGDVAIGPSATMREISNTVMADGKLVAIGDTDIACKVCTIDVVNNIQGYNTCKENGTGREILQQKYHIECTNDYCDVYTELVALEDVVLYGMQVATGINVTGMDYRFIGSESKRGLYTYNGANEPSEGDNKINAIRIINGGYNFDVEYDLNYGLGNKEIGDAHNCMVTDSAKAYFQNIPTGSQINLQEGDSVSWKVRLTIKKA